MISLRGTLLAVLGASSLLAACTQTDGFDNDQTKAKKKKDSGVQTMDEDSKTDEEEVSTDPEDGENGETGKGGEEDPTPSKGNDTETGTDGGDKPANGNTGGESDGGTGSTPPAMSKIKGTGLKCASNAKPTGEMCGGFYCNVTEEDIAAELSTESACKFTAEEICGGKLSTYVGDCARSVKTEDTAAALFQGRAPKTDEQLRPLVRDCVYKKDAKLSESAPEQGCLSCFLDAAACASKHCVDLCLTGDNPRCDQCRMENKCNQMAPSCAGLPSPF